MAVYEERAGATITMRSFLIMFVFYLGLDYPISVVFDDQGFVGLHLEVGIDGNEASQLLSGLIRYFKRPVL